MADTRITPKAGDPITPKGDIPAATTTGTETSRAGNILGAGTDEAVTEAKQMVREAADEQRRRAANALGGMAGALHKAAGDMKTENEMIGRYTDIAAERLDQAAEYLRRSNWEDVLAGAEDMARRQPYWFVGGAMAAGFLLARLVKSSGAAQQRFGPSRRYGQRLASSEVGYGAGTEAGLYPTGSASTSPPSSSVGAAGTITPRSEV